MRRIWRLRPSRSTKRSWSSFCHETRAGLSFTPSSSRPWCSSFMPSSESVPSTRTRYSFSTSESAPIRRLRDAAVLREHDEAGGVDVEAARGREPAQVRRTELGARRVLGPAVLGLDQHHRGLVAVLGLAGDVAHRLVQQDRHLLALVASTPPGRSRSPRRARHARAERRHHRAVDLDPAVLDPLVGFAPRAQAELAHALRQARIVGIFVHRGPGRARAGRAAVAGLAAGARLAVDAGLAAGAGLGRGLDCRRGLRCGGGRGRSDVPLRLIRGVPSACGLRLRRGIAIGRLGQLEGGSGHGETGRGPASRR